jgi:hypothetical protein
MLVMTTFAGWVRTMAKQRVGDRRGNVFIENGI